MSLHIKKILLAFAGLIGVLSSNLVYAHPGHETSVSFLSGLMHPFSGFDHFLVIMLVGFWSAFMLKKIWLGPCVFILGMCLGVFAGLSNLSLHIFEFGIAASVIAMGLLLLVQRQYSNNAILALISFFGIFHGFAHAELFSNGSYGASLVAQDMAGLILATGILHLSGALLVNLLKEKTAIFARVTGFASVIYGWVLISQLSFALLGGAST
ncbi:HupE/UreJ family protein [Polynucleobacter sp. AP-Nickl1-40-C4]|uniref:HupE/UreJ family protein n=1 Tax=Polynucleobacter sp. AP-Nickl1-40-C4 TaxID=3108275 RepID=UPI002B22A0F0|nr:HupE/UreJ family protein [Polynucleobacter sp. AP-Nickl1-40-C4]MEA9569005.1 HupE/UreJ family protein [Polynucleobacter sp. AP-Nickl1-40-C4]